MAGNPFSVDSILKKGSSKLNDGKGERKPSQSHTPALKLAAKLSGK